MCPHSGHHFSLIVTVWISHRLNRLHIFFPISPSLRASHVAYMYLLPSTRQGLKSNKDPNFSYFLACFFLLHPFWDLPSLAVSDVCVLSCQLSLNQHLPMITSGTIPKAMTNPCHHILGHLLVCTHILHLFSWCSWFFRHRCTPR